MGDLEQRVAELERTVADHGQRLGPLETLGQMFTQLVPRWQQLAGKRTTKIALRLLRRNVEKAG